MPNDIRRWEATRQKGRTRYILQTGVLAWGLPMFVIMTFVVNRRADRALSPWMIVISAIIWAIGGACFGLVMWTISEKKYQKYLANLKNE